MNILHITDLHLDNFEGDSEFLRNGFYQEYIDRLYDSIISKFPDTNIDYLIVTGDFINIGKVENYEHIRVILDYFNSKFSLGVDHICLSIGNHDYKWKELAKPSPANERVLKEPFFKLLEQYSSSFIVKEDHFFLTRLTEDCLFLSLDSTWNSQNGAPGSLTTVEIDQIIKGLKDNIKGNTTLLIGCHFPIISFESNFLAAEESNWHESHIWIKASALRDRIKRITTKNTIWFHGDVHASDPKAIDKEVFVLTSKFGGWPDTSEQKRQAVLISVNNDSISKVVCSYEFPSHNQNQSLGDWRCSEKQEIRSLTPVVEDSKELNNTLTPYNNGVEKDILRVIKKRGLYKFGRFHVSDNYISLGWVEITKLMNDKELLNRISDKSYQIIKSNISASATETLFLGIEIIGGILASQLSVRFNARNSVIPIRSKSDHYTHFELSHSSAFENIEEIKDVVIFIDLISSGNTIISLVDEIIAKNVSVNIHVISIISNNIEGRLTSIPKTKSYNTFCSSLKIPVIKHSEMPDESYVQPNLRF